MHKRRVLLSLVMVAAILPATVGTAAVRAAEKSPSLAASLPADKTIAYVHLDLQRTLEQAGKGLAFLDQAAAEKIQFQVKDLYSMVRELASQYDIKPALLDHLTDTDVYLVVLAKETPEKIVHTMKMPKYDKNTFQQIPGEYEERKYTETKNYTTSLVLRTPSDEIATDFVQQFKALLDRRKEKEPDSGNYDRSDVQVDRGQLVSQGKGDLTVGCLDNMIIVSNGNPKELWASLMAPPADKLSDVPIHQKMLSTAGGAPELTGMANLAALLVKSEQSMKDAVDEAQKKVGEGQKPQAGQFDMAALQLQVAQAAYNSFLTFKKLMSLDKIQWAGAGMNFAASDDRATSTSYLMLSHGEPISPVLAELLNGSGKFQPPDVAKKDCLAVLGRVDVGKVLTKVIDALSTMGGPIGMSLQAQLQSVKTQLGVGVDDLLGILDSDFYVYVDIAEKDVEESNWKYDEDTQQWAQVKTKVHKVLPKVSVFWGVKDPAAARDTLNTLVTNMSDSPNMNAFVKKRTYQETDVYCFGKDVTKEGSYPDGETSYAVVIADRYLTVGSWDEVTKAIRLLGAAGSKTDPGMMSLVQANPNANLLVVIPKAFRQKEQKLSAKMSGMEKAFDAMAEQVEKADLGLEDKDLEKRIKTAVGDLLRAYQTIALKSEEHAPDQVVIVGQPDGDFYKITSKVDVAK